MSGDALDFPSRLAQLKDELTRTWTFDGLVALEAEARSLDAACPDTADVALLIGAILRQRLEWDTASQWFLAKSRQFPEAVELAYNAALTAVDGGNYLRGRAILSDLAARMDELSGRQLRGLWRCAPQGGLYEEALLAFARARDQDIEPCIPEIEARLRTAAENAASEAIASVAVVSLGENCLPWSFGQRWGLRPAVGFLDQESPFNLAQTVSDEIAHLFETDLDMLLDPSLLVTNVAENGMSRPGNKGYRFDFNHEWGEQFVADDYAGLVARYTTRIANLRGFLAGRPAVYFHYTERDGDLSRLADAIRAANGHDRFRLVMFDVWPGERTTPLPTGDDVVYHRLSLPREGYVWFRPEDLDSAEGIAFEREILDVLVAAVRSLHRSLEIASAA